MEPKSRLGRGLDALIGGMESGDGTATATEPGQTATVEVGRIQQNPYQPRKRFDTEELEQLTSSIRNHGVLQPLVVRQTSEGFQLIAGERRLRAAQEAGLDKVPVHVVDFNDQQIFEASLVENIQRSDLNPIEKAQGFKDYLERFSMTQDQLAAKIGIDRTSISNLINLLHLPHEVQDAVRTNQVSLGHAKILKGLGDPDLQIRLCKEVTMKGLSVKALEQIAKQAKAEAENAAAKSDATETVETTTTVIEKTPHVLGIENELRQKFSVKVAVKLKAKDKGQIVIGFDSNDDFERIMEMLRR
ncbi:ParB/RepB/Spo0J family partition protein [Tuwongella immobilis]|uniref:HTH cro/C1-type domain-containing protein n=1 Tax=Tuwongella immobilis TaxID=692036 RepID=A0A6C2YH69_9BACT|nr:ParB/RepB/Spo0J family partition protein [Tuwongella immobilis]VIP00609.1 stage 0 sporulation protein j : ParB-like partition protein OS=Singulisphaera acidiphila (strain ATCC BAA-1392 / DSM 18658 / VKM B-2454 / MOB10) GN=Sinac_1718 PE=4 SV=1: ParBc: HTH_3 [Tuwongella immobilis]VTR96636.1 stage 0 sporulation protein j : ParB-like partition protein OS=Singulisphaera acidiphila (strain ATCC BAA-1392 / DSM 18658 / VKM B-2454 / MOB10) GN=Sinac_1718 PE=4 SV=1: ParBc: HTH_3 [Tuwongella immobilis]